MVVGITAPFWTKSSAMGKAVTVALCWPLEADRGFDMGEAEEEPGPAGSAAARARKTQWVFRLRSAELGLARLASA